jgi:hypothetical protein
MWQNGKWYVCIFRPVFRHWQDLSFALGTRLGLILDTEIVWQPSAPGFPIPVIGTDGGSTATVPLSRGPSPADGV